jgi:hypothetical protein
MTREEMRIAVAEHLGWKIVNRKSRIFGNENDFQGCSAVADLYGEDPEGRTDWIPDFAYSLDAMYEAEMTLDKVEQYGKFCSTLFEVIQRDDKEAGFIEAISADPEQRAEAFLKTVGKWKE